MFSLKTTELKGSWIGLSVWLLTVIAYMALLQVFWMPAFWRALFYIGIGLLSATLLIRAFFMEKQRVGIDGQGAYLVKNGHYARLTFVRANSVQLIARVERGKSFVARIWPNYRVIYRDSVQLDQYHTLLSYAAQQILLSRSEEAKKRFGSKA
ncbi:hypothetical protein DFP75_11223 [Marinomonas alcarazii]|uniref:Toxin CptA n=2 Tax=Marinomonas alcarazii TaxID=491949 RepID=A0A318UPK2_9GAMM|nr:hypothetical protein DFP75_11223 [Marinomonas alcarazii]